MNYVKISTWYIYLKCIGTSLKDKMYRLMNSDTVVLFFEGGGYFLTNKKAQGVLKKIWVFNRDNGGIIVMLVIISLPWAPIPHV